MCKYNTGDGGVSDGEHLGGGELLGGEEVVDLDGLRSHGDRGAREHEVGEEKTREKTHL